MTYYTIDMMEVETKEDGKKNWAKWFDDAVATGVKMASKVKADLVREGAQILKSQGKTRGAVVNIGVDRRFNCYSLNQFWYVFYENGQWFFKMDEGCKTKHLIEGIE